MDELDARLTFVTETWLSDGQSLDEDKQDLFLGAGLSMLCKNRPKNSNSNTSYGGVAIFYREDVCNFKEITFPNQDNYEVLTAVGTMVGHVRKVVAVACYIPPNYNSSRGNGALDYIGGLVIEIKRKYRDPYIIISGDFNQWDLATALEEYRDLKEESVGPTRGKHTIDRTFTNLGSVTSVGTLDPLHTEDNRRHSDHAVCFIKAVIPLSLIHI